MRRRHVAGIALMLATVAPGCSNGGDDSAGASSAAPTPTSSSSTSSSVSRAVSALEERLGRKLPVQAKLDKRIPVGGGLGGGSSDAAAMLHGLNALFQLGLGPADLAAIGAPLGSDIPFLVHGGSAELNLDVGALIGKDLRLRGNSVFSMAAYFEALEFLRHTPVPLDQTVTHRFGIEEAVEAFATFDAGGTGKVVFAWDH